MNGPLALPTRAALLALVVGVLTYPAAASAAVVPFDAVALSPVDRGSYTGQTIMPLTVRWTPPSSYSGSLVVQITNRNIAGQDSTLADDVRYQAGRATLERGDADPSSWTNAFFVVPGQPGTYFLQVFAAGAGAECGATGRPCTLASRVFSFDVVAHPAGPWAALERPTPGPKAFVWRIDDATATVRRSIKHGTTRSPFGLRRSCSRAGRVRARCRASWHDRRWIWAGTFKLTIDPASSEVTYSFRGLRASKACLRNATAKRCSRSASF